MRIRSILFLLQLFAPLWGNVPYALVTNSGGTTIQLVNLSNPAIPVPAGSLGGFSGPFAVAAIPGANYALVTNFGSTTIQSVNISNPAVPILAGSLMGFNEPIGVAVISGANYALVANDGNGAGTTIQSVNISNPAVPVLAGSLAGFLGPSGVAVIPGANYALVTNSGNAPPLLATPSDRSTSPIRQCRYWQAPWGGLLDPLQLRQSQERIMPS